jgi:hypothetical protein
VLATVDPTCFVSVLVVVLLPSGFVLFVSDFVSMDGSARLQAGARAMTAAAARREIQCMRFMGASLRSRKARDVPRRCARRRQFVPVRFLPIWP